MADKIPSAHSERRFLAELNRGPFTLVTGLFWLNLVLPAVLRWTGIDQYVGPDLRAALSFAHGGIFLALAVAIIALAVRAWRRTK